MTDQTAAAKTVERYRKLLDSPYGQQLHDHAEIEVLAGQLRELVALAEQAFADDGELDDLRRAATENAELIAYLRGMVGCPCECPHTGIGCVCIPGCGCGRCCLVDEAEFPPCPCGCVGGPDDCTCGGDCSCGKNCVVCEPNAIVRAAAEAGS
jgi:hypothetical protein